MAADGNLEILVRVELDPAEYSPDDLTFFKARVRRAAEEVCPNAAVSVRAGQMRWFDANDDWSRAA